MRSCATRQVDDSASNVLRLAQTAHGVVIGDLVGTARQLEETVGHLAGEETGADGVDGDVAGAQLDGQVAAEVKDGGLAGRIAVGALLAQGADTQAGNTGSDDDARRVLRGSGLLQHRGKETDCVENGLHVKIHDLGKSRVGVGIEGLAPGGAGVGKENVDAVGVLADLSDEVLNTLDVG